MIKYLENPLAKWVSFSLAILFTLGYFHNFFLMLLLIAYGGTDMMIKDYLRTGNLELILLLMVPLVVLVSGIKLVCGIKFRTKLIGILLILGAMVLWALLGLMEMGKSC